MTVKDALNESSSFPVGRWSFRAGELERWQKAVCLSVCLSGEELWLGSPALQRPISKGAPASPS